MMRMVFLPLTLLLNITTGSVISLKYWMLLAQVMNLYVSHLTHLWQISLMSRMMCNWYCCKWRVEKQQLGAQAFWLRRWRSVRYLVSLRFCLHNLWEQFGRRNMCCRIDRMPFLCWLLRRVTSFIVAMVFEKCFAWCSWVIGCKNCVKTICSLWRATVWL